MKILVCGSRFWTNREKIYQVLKNYSGDITIVHGACRGADLLGAAVGRELHFKELAYPADWSMGRKAGPLRNQKMLDENPDISLAVVFHEDLENSLGTKDMLKRIKTKNIPFQIYNQD